MAHEVRVPLAIAKNAAEAALGGDDDPVDDDVSRELLAVIDRNLGLAVLLLDRMSLARSVETDSVELSTKTVDIGHLVRQSVDDLRSVVMGDHPVEVTSEDGLLVVVDPTAAREIVFNLLSNATKYSAPGAPVEVAVTAHDDRVRLVVRNHGTGVTPGHSERIFDKFYQGDQGSQGVGLGLFISRGLARAHGGDLKVRAAAHEGSEFVLDLPRLVPVEDWACQGR